MEEEAEEESERQAGRELCACRDQRNGHTRPRDDAMCTEKKPSELANSREDPAEDSLDSSESESESRKEGKQPEAGFKKEAE